MRSTLYKAGTEIRGDSVWIVNYQAVVFRFSFFVLPIEALNQADRHQHFPLKRMHLTFNF